MPDHSRNLNVPAIRQTDTRLAPSGSIIDLEPDELPVPLAHYFWILQRHFWRIASFVAVCVALALVVCYRLTPIYESTATVDIDFRTPTGIVGQESVQTYYNDADQYLATQVKLIESDSVLRPVAERYRLLERQEERGELDPEELLLSLESPILLRKLKVKRPPNTHLLEISYRSTDRQLASDVANAVADSYLQHSYNIRYRAAAGLSRFMERQLEELRAKMERSSNALAEYEKELNIINPEEQTNILSARLLDLNTEFTKAQTERVAKEAAYRSVKDGSLDAARASAQRDSLRTLTDDFNEARQRFAEIQAHFGPNHPEYKVAAATLGELRGLIDATRQGIARNAELQYKEALDRERIIAQEFKNSKDEFDRLNARSFEYQALKREAEGDKSLYEELLRKIREKTINASFENSSARIADPARPGKDPVFPSVPLTVVITFLLSSVAAVGVAVLSDFLDDTIRDPEEVSRALGSEVIGSLPEVKPWRNQITKIAQNGNGHHRRESDSHSVTGYDEAIRSLRNSILLTDFDRRLRTMLVTSASPSEGKSTIAIHLALAHAQQGKRTLLIDGDLRRPSVHRRFELSNQVGLSDVLHGRSGWREAISHPDAETGLDVLPAGSLSYRRVADTIGPELSQLVDEIAVDYDLVIIDAPPLLGFSEPLQMAAAVDGVVIAVRAGQTSRRAVGSVLSTLARLRANVVGVVLNEVTHKLSDRYYYGYYHKYYRHYHSKDLNGEEERAISVGERRT